METTVIDKWNTKIECADGRVIVSTGTGIQLQIDNDVDESFIDLRREEAQ
jgi:hypothetical protein